MRSLGAYLFGLLVAFGVIGSAYSAPDLGQVQDQARQIASDAFQKAGELGKQARTEVDKVAAAVEQSAQAKELTAGLLQPIYQLAEAMSFPMFYWLAFALMLAGVVGFGLQLVLGKLVVLVNAGFDLSEIVSDAIVLAISLIGLILTTQAATQNSTFTQSPISVLSSAIVGIVVGVVLYIWGQTHELDALEGRE